MDPQYVYDLAEDGTEEQPLDGEDDEYLFGQGPVMTNDGWYQMAIMSDTNAISRCAFDSFEEIIWTSTVDGFVSGYVQPEGTKFASFRAQPGPVTHLMLESHSVLSVSAEAGPALHSRGGVVRWRMDPREFLPSATEMSTGATVQCTSCAFANPSHTELAVSMSDKRIKVFDLASSKVGIQTLADGVCSIMKSSGRFLCCGDSAGRVLIRDPRSLRVVQTLHAHSGAIGAMDVCGDTLLTCGFTGRLGTFYPDPSLRVFDLRMMRPRSQVPFPAGAAQVRFDPLNPNKAFVCSLNGVVQAKDLSAAFDLDSEPFQINLAAGGASAVLSFDVCSNASTMLATDDQGYAHLWTCTPEDESIPFCINDASRPTVFPWDEAEERPLIPPHTLAAVPEAELVARMEAMDDLMWWDESDEYSAHNGLSDVLVPEYDSLAGYIESASSMGCFGAQEYSSLALRCFSEQRASPSHPVLATRPHLASRWPPKRSYLVGQPPKKLLPAIADALKWSQFVGYATNPGIAVPSHAYRQVSLPWMQREGARPKMHHHHHHGGRGEGRARSNSGAYEDGHSHSNANAMNVVVDPAMMVASAGLSRREFLQQMKLKYLFVPITQGRTAWEEFDFMRYNKTEYTGLENILPNSYCNSLLQALYWIVPLRKAMLTHEDDQQYSISTELGFLFHMLTVHKGGTAQAANFLRIFQQIKAASALGLFDANSVRSMAAAGSYRITMFFRFVLEQLHKEVVVAARQSASFSLSIDLSQLALSGGSTSTGNVTIKSAGKQKNKQARKGSTSSAPGYAAVPSSGGANAVAVQAQSANSASAAPSSGNGGATFDEESSIIEIMFGMRTEVRSSCLSRPGVPETVRQSHTYAVDLVLPMTSVSSTGAASVPTPSATGIGAVGGDHLTAEKTLIGPGERSFVDVINASLSPETRLRMFWPSTNSWEPSIQKKVTKALSPVLCFNAAQSNEDVTWWRRVAEYDIKSALHHMPQEVQTWIPATMDAFFDEQRGCYQVRSSGNEKTPAEDVIRYELSTVVYQILDEFAENDEHFVALIKVAPQRWILFNDFTVIEVNDVEARQCMPWKIPAIIMYSNPNHRAFTAPLSVLPASVSSLYQLAVSNPEGPSSLWTENSVIIKDNVFYDDTNMALRASTLPASFVPLAPPEMPRRGDVVALDAEFVALRIEEAEVMSDGRRKVTRPSLLYLARVSVLRGDNAVPFVDDYIHTPEPVADYLTRFSGLHPGDLDPSQSKHHLTSLKNAYRKLRYLVDRGVMFVGHSLKQDFRIINIFVPPEQIIDTSELFRFEGQRKISLRFLARHVLQQDIQEDTHDSIEDARTALLLYKKYVKLREAGKVEDALQDIYAAGRAKNWQV